MCDEDKVTKTVLVLHETIVQSIARDVFTFVMIIGVIGTGWWLGSTAMQWFGFLMLTIFVVVRDAAKSMTPQAAANLLRDRFGVRAE